MADPPLQRLKENKALKVAFAVSGIMSTLVIYGVLQEKIMRVPYGPSKEYFKYSLFIVFCNRITTSSVAAGVLLAHKNALDPVAPLYKYSVVSVANILTTTCQYEALKYVSFPVQTLAKCAKMIPVMAAGDINPYSRGRENTVWGVSLMMGYLGFDGFTSTFQDKLFKGYNMEIYNQIFYTTLCSCILSFVGLILQGNLPLAIDFVSRHSDCFFDIAILSTLVSILMSCVWFAHPLSSKQCIGAVIVFASLYAKSFLKSKQKSLSLENTEKGTSSPLRENP